MHSSKKNQAKSISHLSIIESIKDAVIVSELNGNILYTNQAADKLFDYKPGEMIGNDIDIIFPTGLKHEKKKMMESILWGENIDNYETERIDKNNRTMYVSVSLSAFRDDKGKLQGMTKVLRDITEKKKSEGKFQALLESAPDAMVIVNNFGQMVLVNAQTEKLFGFTRAELMGEDLEKLIPISFKNRENDRWKNFFDDPKVRKMGGNSDLLGLRKDGLRFPVDISTSPLELEEGLFMSAAIRDITKQKKSEIDLKNYAERLEVSNNKLKQFAYIASHDLKVPLRKILLFTGRMLDNPTITKKGRTYFQLIQKTAYRMLALIEDLLSFSKLTTKEKVFERRDLGKVIKDIKKTFKEEVKEKQATIEIGELCEADIIVFQFEQLMLNLISNALKFSKPDTPPYINIKAKSMKGSDFKLENLQPDVEYCRLTVSDNGIGFEKEYREKVFEVFERLHSKDEYEGTGIGLAIVKKIVENHDGFITVKSELNRGTVFEIFFPVHNN